MKHHPTVSRDEWLVARKQLLTKEKELTHMRDQLSAQRRELPWVKVEKPYIFDGPEGKVTLADLFAGRSQLIVYHFMFDPEWDAGCPFCSFLADHIGGALVHLEHHDVSVAVISRAPMPKIAAYQKRMGWRFKWVSAHNSDFNSDYHVSFTKDDLARGATYYNFAERQSPTAGEAPGTSVFFKDESGEIFHTYSSYARGGEALLGTYNFLDMTPGGRNENGPNHNLTDWVKRHDEYDSAQERHK